MKHSLATLAATAAIILGSAVPTAALAYISPFEVFGEDMTAAEALPSTRGGYQAVQNQQANSVSGQYQAAQKLASSSEMQHAAADDVVQTEQPNQPPRLSLRYADLISASEAVFGTPRVA